MKPKYLQIIDDLKLVIETLNVNDPILSERELESKLDASRMTVRKAIDSLVDDGYLYRKPNSGTYVADPSFRKRSNQLSIVNSALNTDNISTLFYDVRSHDLEIGKALGIKPDETFIRLVRLNKTEEGVPSSIDEIYISKYKFDSEKMDVKDLFKFQEFFSKGKMQQRYLPCIVPIKYAKLLGMELNAPIIKTETKVFSITGEILAFITSFVNHNVKDILFVI